MIFSIYCIFCRGSPSLVLHAQQVSSEPLASISALLASACPFSHPPRFVLLAKETAEFILTASPLLLFLLHRFRLDAARKPGTRPHPACLRERWWMPNGQPIRYLFAKLNEKLPIGSYIHLSYSTVRHHAQECRAIGTLQNRSQKVALYTRDESVAPWY